MKKLLSIVVLSLLLCNVGSSEIAKLNISLNEPKQETEIFIPSTRYNQSCEADLGEFIFKQNTKTYLNNNKLSLSSEFIFPLNEYGEFKLKHESKVNSEGKLTKSKIKDEYIPGSTKVSKKELNQFKKFLKSSIKSNISYFDLVYGNKLTPGKTLNKKLGKETLKIIKDNLKVLFESEGVDINTLKKFYNKLKVDVYINFIGSTEINSVKFYVLIMDMEMEYFGNNLTFKQFMREYKKSAENVVYMFLHAPSGYFNFNVQYEDAEQQQTINTICTIYKDDKKIVEVDISEYLN